MWQERAARPAGRRTACRPTTWSRAVRRDMHKMHAFVRFRPVVEPDGQTLHMAWFEPDHYITEANAGFFIRRFTQMRWAILCCPTPACAGTGSNCTPAPARSAATRRRPMWARRCGSPTTATSSTRAAQAHHDEKEMPTRYWHNLPEAALITELAQTAHERSAKMVEAEATVPRRRIAGKETRA